MSATSEFYFARAAESAAQAETALLDNVRDRCLRAEAAWLLMAERSTKAEVSRREQISEKAERDRERLA
jgi:hypothetical protein